MEDVPAYDIFDESDESETAEDWAELTLGDEYTIKLPLHRVHVWASSKLMADWILRNPDLVEGKTVAELGSGLGLPSIAAALAGADKVTATDLSETALNGIMDVVRNNVDSYPKLKCLETSQLDWEEALGENYSSEFGEVDVLLAADVNYESSMTGPLCAAIHHSMGPFGDLYLASREGRISLNDCLSTLKESPTLHHVETEVLHDEPECTHSLYRFTSLRSVSPRIEE